MEKMSTEKRSEILEAAINLFSVKGFERTTVDEIAAKANVGKGTIYLYFRNKEHIFLAIVEEGISYLKQLFLQVTKEKDFTLQLRELILSYLKFAEDNREIYRLFMKERLAMRLCNDSIIEKRFIEMHHELYQFFTDFMQRGMDEGVLRPADPGYLGMALNGIISHCVFHWLYSNDQQPLTKLTDTLCHLFLKGAASNLNLHVSGGVQDVS